MGKHSSNIQLIILFILGILLWQIPIPAGLTSPGWHLLIIFVITIAGIILGPVPISVVSLFGGLACVLTQTLTLNEVLSGFSSSIIWIVVFAFFIARALIKTGLGRRVAYYFISKVGRTTLGLSYGLICTEFLLSSMIPSITARSGGIIYPIARSIIDAYGSGNSPSAIRRTGGFIIQICFQAATITSAMFVTAMAGNPLAVNLAETMGVKLTWATWAIGAIVPGLTSLFILPLVLFFIYPPAIRINENSLQLSQKALAEMGPLSRHEIYMLAIFVLLLFLWILGSKIGLDATTSAWIGVVLLLLTGVLTWNDAVSEKNAWDTLVWFAMLLTLSGFLGKLGVMHWLGQQLESILGVGYSRFVVSLSILVIYIYIHYFFASVTAHITVFYVIFSGLLISLGGMKPMPALLLLAYASSLSGSLTHYGNAAAPIFYEAKYLSTSEWWKIGFIVCTVNVLTWILCGYLWWSVLGWV